MREREGGRERERRENRKRERGGEREKEREGEREREREGRGRGGELLISISTEHVQYKVHNIIMPMRVDS